MAQRAVKQSDEQAAEIDSPPPVVVVPAAPASPAPPAELPIPRAVRYRDRDGRTYHGTLIALHVNTICVETREGAIGEKRAVARIEVEFAPAPRQRRITVDGIPRGPLASPRACWWTEA